MSGEEAVACERAKIENANYYEKMRYIVYVSATMCIISSVCVTAM